MAHFNINAVRKFSHFQLNAMLTLLGYKGSGLPKPRAIEWLEKKVQEAGEDAVSHSRLWRVFFQIKDGAIGDPVTVEDGGPLNPAEVKDQLTSIAQAAINERAGEIADELSKANKARLAEMSKELTARCGASGRDRAQD